MAEIRSFKQQLQLLLDRSTWPRITVAVLALLALDTVFASWGFIQSWVLCYAPGAHGNNFTGVWINGFAFVLVAQALCVLFLPQLVLRRPARFWAWLWYTVWMGVCCLILLIAMHLPDLASQYAWAFLWLPPLATIACAAITHRRKAAAAATKTKATAAGASPQPGTPAVVDVEAVGPGQRPRARAPACSRAAWRSCWANYWAFVGWSSLFWPCFLGFFLALQAAWLVTDDGRFPPPGVLYTVPLLDGTGYAPTMHMRCQGPQTPGLSTFLLEAGGGSPGIAYAGLADELSAAGRRVCWYDRVGLGWSSDLFLTPPDGHATNSLLRLLQVSGEPGPFIVAGHSAGGQLALLFGAAHPFRTAGLALLDSYDNVAISLAYSGSQNVSVTLKDGSTVVRPALTYFNPALVSVLDVLRAVSPLAWGRFITSKPGSNYSHAAAMDAAYGNNKEWQAQWVEVVAAVRGGEDASDALSHAAGRRFWQGTGWPSFGAKPVLLLPAEKTLQPSLPPACAALQFGSDAACQAMVAADPSRIYPNLYVAYLSTLGSNVSMVVMPGGHGFPQSVPQIVAAALLEKFSGV